jgi:hypothetical protein
VTSPATAVPVGPVNVKVVALMVAGFIALLKAAVTIVSVQAPVEPLSGATVVTKGGVRPAFAPVLSGSLHAVAIMSSKNDVKQIVFAPYLRISIVLLD